MNILLLGKPGSGKGTQSGLLVKRFKMVHVSTGDMLRQAKERSTRLGLAAYKYWWDGGYVPDDIMIPLMEEQITPILKQEKYLGDGYPRTMPQAETFDVLTRRLGTRLHAVILLRVSDDFCRDRLMSRSYCSRCKINYNTTSPLFTEQMEGICNRCRGPLEKRVDDAPDRIDYRLKDVYVKLVMPLYQYYRDRDILHEVDGAPDPYTVNDSIIRKLRKIT